MTMFDIKLGKLSEYNTLNEKYKIVFMWIKQGKITLTEYKKIMAIIPY